MAQAERDIPQGNFLNADLVSSIGSIGWPPEKASFERAKGFVGEVIESEAALNDALHQLIDTPFTPEMTRICGRMVIGKDLVRNLAENSEQAALVETVVDLNGTGIGVDDCALVYVGKNHSSRLAPDNVVRAEYDRMRSIIACERPPRHLDHEGFTFDILSPTQRESDEILAMYEQLYAPFGWNIEDIQAMLANPNNVIFAAFDRGRVVSSALGESGTINLQRRGQSLPFTMVEITEAATLADYQGQGLYRSVSNALLRHLANEVQPNLTYGETNLQAPGVLKTAVQQGRTTGLHTAQQFGIPHAWYLPQHVTISQGTRPDNYRYNDLMVAYLTRDSLVQQHGTR